MVVRSREQALSETPFLKIDDLMWLKTLKSWLTEEQWDKVMVRNPSSLYTRERDCEI